MWAEKANAWVRELKREGMDEQRKEKAWVKKEESLSPYKGGRDPAPPHLLGKLTYYPSVAMKTWLDCPYPY